MHSSNVLPPHLDHHFGRSIIRLERTQALRQSRRCCRIAAYLPRVNLTEPDLPRWLHNANGRVPLNTARAQRGSRASWGRKSCCALYIRGIAARALSALSPRARLILARMKIRVNGRAAATITAKGLPLALSLAPGLF